MESLLKNEKESKKDYFKRLKLYQKGTPIPNIKGFNDTAKIDRLVIIEVIKNTKSVKDSKVSIYVFNTVSQKVAFNETLTYLGLCLGDYFTTHLEEELRRFKFRGNKTMVTKDFTLDISCIKGGI